MAKLTKEKVLLIQSGNQFTNIQKCEFRNGEDMYIGGAIIWICSVEKMKVLNNSAKENIQNKQRNKLNDEDCIKCLRQNQKFCMFIKIKGIHYWEYHTEILEFVN